MAPTALDLITCPAPPHACDHLDTQVNTHPHTGAYQRTAGLSLIRSSGEASLAVVDEHPANWCLPCMRSVLRGYHASTCPWAVQVSLALVYLAVETLNQLHARKFPDENEDQRQAYQDKVMDRVLANLDSGMQGSPDAWHENGFRPTSLTNALKAYVDADGYRAASHPSLYATEDEAGDDTGRGAPRSTSLEAMTENSLHDLDIPDRLSAPAHATTPRPSNSSYDTTGLPPVDDFYLNQATRYEQAAHSAEQRALAVLQDSPAIDSHGNTAQDVLEIALSMFHQASIRGTKESKKPVYGPVKFSRRTAADYIRVINGVKTPNSKPVAKALDTHIMPALTAMLAEESLPPLEHAYLTALTDYLAGADPITVPVPKLADTTTDSKDHVAADSNYHDAIVENTDPYRHALRDTPGTPS